MIRTEYEMNLTIQTRDAEEFDARCNDASRTYSNKDVKVTRMFDAELGFIAFVTWTEREAIPENAKDRAELRGERYVCGECPYYVRPTDGRVKNTDCSYDGSRVWFDKCACETLYLAIEKGEMRIV